MAGVFEITCLRVGRRILEDSLVWKEGAGWACHVGLGGVWGLGRQRKTRGGDLDSERRFGKNEIGWDIEVACS